MRRDKVASTIPEWEEMRKLASEIKQHTLTNLDRYLEQFIANAEANGIHVHRARDAKEHNEIIPRHIPQSLRQDRDQRKVHDHGRVRYARIHAGTRHRHI